MVRGTILMLTSSVAYGISPMLVRFLYAFGLNSNSLLMYRTGIASALLLIPIAWKKNSLRLKRRDFGRIALLSFFAAGAMLTLVESFMHTDLGIATSLHFTYPLFVSVIGALFFGLVMTRARVFSLILALAGVAFLSGSRVDGRLIGLILAVLSGLFYAIYMIMLDHMKFPHLTGMALSFYLNAGITIYTIVYSLLFRPILPLQGFRMIGLMILLSLVNSIIALWTFQSGIAVLGAARSAILSTLEPVVSVIAGAAAFGESLDLFKGLGIVMILASLLISNLQLFRRPA